MIETFNRPSTVLLVEPRDEVFARLAADLGALGVRVRRAENAAIAAQRHVRRPANVIILSADLPDESAWLFSRKLRLSDNEVPIWIYTAWASETDIEMANFVMADELIDYGGDLWQLSAEVVDRLGVPRGARGPTVAAWARDLVPAFA